MRQRAHVPNYAVCFSYPITVVACAKDIAHKASLKACFSSSHSHCHRKIPITGYPPAHTPSCGPIHPAGHCGGTIKSSNGPVVFPLLCFHIDSVEPHGNRTDVYPALDVTPCVVKLVLVRN
ncbi:hypothetical protein HYPSUDRAFT_45832 [Hypholoma sublateritium FD-334 SS-4]|uniref:Uncharacterized protein n=1 Tax=Hypholoma sublateritium (strain FD-334 SS-4) TaxID=945553 RepID=A0A0D2M3S6_HYPSF|nr:hypothetical protein HYPSUDRAFT_45832 [Hypholoma sublateritium FD-334 SS-4]